jgi:hypothetical protein
MTRRLTLVVAGLALLAGVAACSDSDDSADSTTTTANRGFEVQTPEGQVSLSLSGNLPPNWPDDFPVPSGAEPAGSGSLGDSSQTGLVGVYSSSQNPQDVYNFYQDDADLQVDSASSVGSGSAYLGTVGFSGEWSGYVVVLPYDEGALMVVLLSQGSPGTTLAGSTTTTGS